MKPKGRPKKSKILTDAQWLNTEVPPEEIELTQSGGYHIPIGKLRPLLDRLNACVTQYHATIYKSGYADVCAHGSLQLTVTIDGKEKVVTGAYNLNIADTPNGFWNGTLKSECIKNAALELGKRFGRELNKDVPKAEPTQVAQTVATRLKAQPDDKIMLQYKAALGKGDQAAIDTLKNIYEIKSEADATQK